MRRRLARVREDSGAAALEFALVSFVLFPLVFGIIDYGIYFADASGLRSGVRQAARQAAVGRCPNVDCIVATTKDNIDTVAGGQEFVRVKVHNDWSRGQDVEVCAAVKVAGLTGLTPFPDGGFTTTRVTMRIEQDQTSTMVPPEYDGDPLPGDGWDFCP